MYTLQIRIFQVDKPPPGINRSTVPRGNPEEHGISVPFVLFGQTLLLCFVKCDMFSHVFIVFEKLIKGSPPPRSINTTHSWISYVFLLYSIGLLLLVFRLELVETREERSIKIAYIRSSCASFVCLLTRLLCLEQDARL